MSWFLTPDSFVKKSPTSIAEKHIIDLYNVTPHRMWDMMHNGQADFNVFKAWWEIHSSIDIPKRDKK